jgi:hypothetical protein
MYLYSLVYLSVYMYSIFLYRRAEWWISAISDILIIYSFSLENLYESCMCVTHGFGCYLNC